MLLGVQYFLSSHEFLTASGYGRLSLQLLSKWNQLAWKRSLMHIGRISETLREKISVVTKVKHAFFTESGGIPCRRLFYRLVPRGKWRDRVFWLILLVCAYHIAIQPSHSETNGRIRQVELPQCHDCLNTMDGFWCWLRQRKIIISIWIVFWTFYYNPLLSQSKSEYGGLTLQNPSFGQGHMSFGYFAFSNAT